MNIKFIIFSNVDKDPEKQYINYIADLIRRKGGTVVDAIHMNKEDKIGGHVIQDADMIISLGGDGTFLNIARQIYRSGKPILGINTGTLGFLSEMDYKDAENNIEDVIEGNYQIYKRMMLKGIVFREEKEMKKVTALNDLVISRGEISKIVKLSIYINDSYVDTFPGDGIVVSTPTGSTGYSLSAGGPVMDHNEELMIITPICPHTMHARSFITSKNSKIMIKVEEPKDFSCSLTVDGQKGYTLIGQDKVVITRSHYSVQCIQLNKNCFFETLRNKIYYRSK